jgi:hypothetical protein
MSIFKFVLLIILFLPNLNIASNELPTNPDKRYCGSIQRDSSGAIARDRRILASFQRIYKCPSTDRTYGACPGWAIDHIIPLSCGGCDSIENLQWLPLEIKSCSQPYCKDRFERKVYSGYTNNPYCNNTR